MKQQQPYLRGLRLFCLFSPLFLTRVSCLSATLRQRFPGIWKLTLQSALEGDPNILKTLTQNDNKFPNTREDGYRDSNEIAKTNGNENPAWHPSQSPVEDPQQPQLQHKEVLIKIQDNGFFRQCDEGYQEGKWISGRWEIVESPSCCLYLAMDRQYFGPPHDTLLSGKFLQETDQNRSGKSETTAEILTIQGEVSRGKFVHPKNHPGFFQALLTDPQRIGTFHLQQKLSFATLLSGDQSANETESDSDNTQQVGDEPSFQISDIFTTAKLWTSLSPSLPMLVLLG